VAIAQCPNLIGSQRDVTLGVCKQDEVVSRSVALGEM